MAFDRLDHHYPAKQWLEQQEEIGAIGVCFSTKLSLLRLLTNPAVMGVDVCTAQEAWRIVDGFLEDPRFLMLQEPEGLERQLRELTMPLKHTPKLWQDAYLAAFAMRCGRKVVTFDRGFRFWKGLAVEVLG
jgi:toxin-antitoxin system PIN domain toxin